MKAAVFYGKHDLRIEDIAMPEPKAGEVLIRVHACGICGTDVHIFHGDEGAAKTPPRTVLGHEFAGEIVAVGEGVTAVQVGERVCVDPNRLCGDCYYCKSGIGHFCEAMVGIGTTVNGGFAEYCAVPASQVYPFPASLSYEKAAMTEPVACCLHGIEMCNIRSGDTVAVIGGGPAGMSAAVIFVMVLATAVTYPIHHFVLVPNWLAYLDTVVFILVIATLVQILEMLLKKLSPASP